MTREDIVSILTLVLAGVTLGIAIGLGLFP